MSLLGIDRDDLKKLIFVYVVIYIIEKTANYKH